MGYNEKLDDCLHSTMLGNKVRMEIYSYNGGDPAVAMVQIGKTDERGKETIYTMTKKRIPVKILEEAYGFLVEKGLIPTKKEDREAF